MDATEFNKRTRHLVGLEITRPWRGHGSCIALEIGPLVRKFPGSGRPRANADVMIEWSWRVESQRAIQFGSWSGEVKMNNGIASLKGLTVEEISLEGRLPELSLRLSGGRWLRSFMTAEGQPMWTVFVRGDAWVTARRRGRVVYETRSE
jgi:hypothetical protein